jgi:hypothetical protein
MALAAGIESSGFSRSTAMARRRLVVHLSCALLTIEQGERLVGYSLTGSVAVCDAGSVGPLIHGSLHVRVVVLICPVGRDCLERSNQLVVRVYGEDDKRSVYQPVDKRRRGLAIATSIREPSLQRRKDSNMRPTGFVCYATTCGNDFVNGLLWCLAYCLDWRRSKRRCLCHHAHKSRGPSLPKAWEHVRSCPLPSPQDRQRRDKVAERERLHG